REMIAGPALPQDRRLAPGRLGARDAGQGIEPGFVYTEDRQLPCLSPLLMAGHVSARPRAIASSSRWRARRMGFCGLRQRALRRRPTWAGWYTTPHATRITSTTRFRGQTWPRNP